MVFPHLRRARLFHKFCSAATASKYYMAGGVVFAGTFGVTYLIGDSLVYEFGRLWHGKMGLLEAAYKVPVYGGAWAANWAIGLGSFVALNAGIIRKRRKANVRALAGPV